MNLKDWLRKENMSINEFARKCLCAATTITKVLRENRCTENISVLIRFATKGEVTCEEMKVVPNVPKRKSRWAKNNR